MVFDEAGVNLVRLVPWTANALGVEASDHWDEREAATVRPPRLPLTQERLPPGLGLRGRATLVRWSLAHDEESGRSTLSRVDSSVGRPGLAARASQRRLRAPTIGRPTPLRSNRSESESRTFTYRCRSRTLLRPVGPLESQPDLLSTKHRCGGDGRR